MRKTVSFLLIFAIYLGMFAPLVSQVNAQRTAGGKTVQNYMSELPEGLKFRLSEGVEGAENREKQPATKGDALTEGETSNLLKRIPEIKPDDADRKDFNKRAGTLPPPKTGKMIPVKFPAPEQRDPLNVDAGKQPLQVLRFSPEGEISLAPDLSVTFSQPMVAVGSQEQAAQTIPVQLTPNAEGNWRWLGTKTLMFDTTKRFPMATRFTARVPAGTKAATGQVLQKDVTWTFTTPPPKVEQMIPANQTTRRDALMFVSFDQEINPEAVLKTITVTGGGKKLPVRLATPEEIERDGGIAYYAKQAQPKRWLAFRAVNAEGAAENALPGDAAIAVTVNKGTPSAEGPLTTTKDQSCSFRTFGAMRFTGGYCGWRGNKTCSPFETWYLEFSNSIDAANFAKEMVKVEPAVEGLNIYPSGNFIYFEGYKKGRTTYKISVDNRLKDIYGQNLAAPAAATITVGSAEQNLYTQGGNFVVLDPTAKPAYSIYSTNYRTVRVKIYAVQPTDWYQFQRYARYINYDDGAKKLAMPGRLVSEKVVTIENKPDEMVETRIDLAEALNEGFGHAIVDIEPTVRRDKYDRTRILAWAQATQIGLDAFVDNQELVSFVTDLKTGKPLSGVDVSIYPNGKAAGGQPSAVSEEKEQTVAQSWWGWLSNWGTPEESVNKETEAVEENGEATKTETVAQAQSNQTPANGILRLALPDEQAKQPNLLIAKRGKDVAFMPEQSDYYWQDYGSWHKKGVDDSLRWFVFDDRKMYRPKEEVSVKGYIRVYEGGKFGDIQPLGDRAGAVFYMVRDAQNNEISKGTVNLNSFGAFDFKFKLPDNINL
ncbi:MAG TPA: Ig-like domain-containing protein, partial [Pyrinomonadaceae bacterium]|nr:Ig-like domain-containing protein [Pyrinomonadaceae bacterium]